MCRLAYISKPFKNMKTWLKRLEKSAGGDGTGVVSENILYKAVTLNATNSVTLFKSYPILWHSRRVSSGPKEDYLCHPFPCGGGYLAHNGHWQCGHVAAQSFNDLHGGELMSDSAFFAKLVDKLGFFEAVKKYRPSGVWLHMNVDGELAVWKYGGSLFYSKGLDAWGSEAAAYGKWFTVEDGYYNYDEIPVEPKPIKETKTVNYNYTGPRYSSDNGSYSNRRGSNPGLFDNYTWGIDRKTGECTYGLHA